MGNPSSLLRDAWQNFAGHHFAFFIPDLAKALSLRYRILLSSLEIIDGKFRLSLRYRGLFFARCDEEVDGDKLALDILARRSKRWPCWSPGGSRLSYDWLWTIRSIRIHPIRTFMSITAIVGSVVLMVAGIGVWDSLYSSYCSSF